MIFNLIKINLKQKRTSTKRKEQIFFRYNLLRIKYSNFFHIELLFNDI